MPTEVEMKGELAWDIAISIGLFCLDILVVCYYLTYLNNSSKAITI